MRLARFATPDDREWVGIAHAEVLEPVAPGSGHAGQEALLRIAMGGEAPPPIADPVPVATARMLTPLPEPPSIRDFYAFEAHVRTARAGRGLEMEPDWYELPVFYFTNPAAVLGPGEPVCAPAGSEALDYELEVACVMGAEVVDADPIACTRAVAGFTIMNDWSARDLQRREMRQSLGPAKGKDFATSLGPWLVTPDELPGWEAGRPSGHMLARVNGAAWSEGELADMHFTWGELLAHACRDTRLRAGDVIGSGTVGTGCILELSLSHGSERYPWLVPGDVVELEVERLGALRTPVVERR